ncbi:MAG: LysM peptidoglycan-binding domain-containing protein [Lachnospiraceae bacterium]|nr:LysM peptidoglycan-binding domain-containing protein [Lachnospiraceae bacterium]
MDKQTNILTNTQNVIPVNTRTIGAPEGIYILYLEDYVHTFIKKLLSDNNAQCVPIGEKQYQEYQIEKTLQQDIALYGRSVEENGRYRIVISGAAVSDGGRDKIQQMNNTYFPSCTYIGNAGVSLNKDSRLRLELTLRSTKVILDDFYIYYDQNEEMQNYLIEWNTTRENDKGKVILSPTEHDTHIRSNTNDAARLSRITQAYNREEAKVSFMWNVMNVLCLGFVVCVMAYGIISVNNYNKMQRMQANIDYCLAFVAENTSFHINAPQTDMDKTQTASTLQQNVQTENVSAKQEETQEIEAYTDGTQEEAAPAVETGASAQDSQPTQELTQSEEAPQTTQALAQAVVSEAQDNTAQSAVETNAQPTQEQSTTPQYYIVRKGDTLRTICYDIYGDYSRVDEICQWNNIDNPNNILYGQKLLLP